MYGPVSSMKLRHSKRSSDDEIEPTTESLAEPKIESTGTNWKCASCGAENEDFRKFCDGCGDKTPGANVTATGIPSAELHSYGSRDSTSTCDDNRDTREKG